MSEWDYGQADQVAEEWDAAVKRGLCHLCIIYPAQGKEKNRPCRKCEDEIEEARCSGNRYDDADADDGFDSQNIPEGK